MAAAVVGDGAVPVLGQEPGGRLPGVRVEWPAVAEQDRGAADTPVLVEDLGPSSACTNGMWASCPVEGFLPSLMAPSSWRTTCGA